MRRPLAGRSFNHVWGFLCNGIAFMVILTSLNQIVNETSVVIPVMPLLSIESRAQRNLMCGS
ncbi:MAG: hypothetical protein ABTQ34_08610 [Bdellovibrionales bacterium]